MSIMRLLLLKKIVVENVKIKCQSYSFFSYLSMFHLVGEFKNRIYEM
jgi:hypothetical protein